jgi:serine phosphatase RsbU (regulator of sigma subunit)
MEDMSAPVIDVAWYQRPFPGETVCGDAVGSFQTPGGLWLVIADGLGHGPTAHAAASPALRLVSELAHSGASLPAHAGNPGITLDQVLLTIHDHLKGTVGAAVGLAFLETVTGILRFVGVGNTALRRLGSADTRLVSRDGVVGQRLPSPRPAEMSLLKGDLILFTSDGVTERFGIDDYPGLRSDSAATVSRSVVERFGRRHDDATCLALRYGA